MYYDYIKKSFKEITDMTTNKSPLWKFVIYFPIAYNDIDDNVMVGVKRKTIILDFKTFEEGFTLDDGLSAEVHWDRLTTWDQDKYPVELFFGIWRVSDLFNLKIVHSSTIIVASRTLLN